MSKSESSSLITGMLPLAVIAIIAFAGTFVATRWWRSSEDAGSEKQKSEVGPVTNHQSPITNHPPGMVWIPGGEFTMGSDDPDAWPEEKPAHRVKVDGFWIDTTEVTNAQFLAFVQATGYVTTAERKPDWEEMKKQLPPGTPKPPDDQLVPASLVFAMTERPVPLNDISQWWKWTPGDPRVGGNSLSDLRCSRTSVCDGTISHILSAIQIKTRRHRIFRPLRTALEAGLRRNDLPPPRLGE